MPSRSYVGNPAFSRDADTHDLGIPYSTRDDRFYESGLRPLEDQINRRRYAEFNDRRQQMGLLDKAFDAPNREKYYGSLYESALGSGLGLAQDASRQQMQGAQFNAADRGLLGGSSDINKRAGIGRALDYASLGAENQAHAFANQYRRADENKRVNLLRLIQSGDPASQAAIASQLHGISDVTQQGLVNEQLQQLAAQQQQAHQNAQSQTIGNALGWAGTQYGVDQNARGAGGQGLSWVPQFGYSNTAGVGSR